MNSTNQLIVTVNRDSVCAGDDIEDHEAEFFANNNITIAHLIELAIKACPLAQISGGKATWIICLPKIGFKYIGVVAQEWKAPKLIVTPETSVEKYFGTQQIEIEFKYWCQANPDLVFAAVESGSELPNRY